MLNTSLKVLSRTLATLIVIGVLVGTVACVVVTPGPAAQAPAPTEEAAATVEAAVQEEPAAAATGGTLTIASAEAPEFLDPTKSLQILNWNISFTMFDTLVKVDAEGNISPSLAESWEIVSPTAWKFTLRDGVKFHDGSPFTSASVKATLDHITNPDVGARQIAIWQLYDHAETPDDRTVIIYTKEPMGTMLSSLTLTAMIPPNSIDTLNEKPIGTGPFKFVEWVKDDHLTVEANPDYWGGPPKLERIIFRTIPELATRVSALEAGEVDIVDIVPSEEFDRLEGAGINLIKQPTTYLRFIWLGNEGPLSNPKVRQAINLAIDRDTIINELFPGEAYPVTGCVSAGVVGYCEMKPLQYDPAQAKALLAEAGYADGFDMELKTAEYLSKQKELAEVVKSYLGDIGINVNITIQDQALWIEDLLALNWQAEQIGTGTLTGDADYTLRRLYHSSAKRVPYTNEELDKLLIAEVGELDAAKRQDLFCQVCDILWQDVPVVYLFGTIQVYGLNARVQNFETRPTQFFFLKDVSVTQ
jgi:peptide/nickel transport system substrate-binding protein